MSEEHGEAGYWWTTRSREREGEGKTPLFQGMPHKDSLSQMRPYLLISTTHGNAIKL